MNLIDQEITKILSAPFYKYRRWCVKVEIEDEGGKGETLIMEDTKLKVLEKAKIGNIIQR